MTNLFTALSNRISPVSLLTKKAVVKTGFFALGRVLEYLSYSDESIKAEHENWPQGYKFYMKVLPKGPSLAMEKNGDKMVFLGTKELDKADMVVEVKNIDTAFKMITAQLGAHHVYAQHKIGVIGNVADSMKLIRMIYAAEDYMFPPIMSKNVLKNVEDCTLQRAIKRFRVLVFGLVLKK